MSPSTKKPGLFFKCCFTSRETISLIRDGEPRTATSTLTQLLNSAGLGLSQVLSFNPFAAFRVSYGSTGKVVSAYL